MGYSELIRNKKFRYLWLSQFLSQVTIQLMNFLLLARLYTVTGSSIATSLLWVAYCLPALFIGPLSAAFVDIAPRKKILMITNLLQSLTILLYTLISHQSVFILYAVVLIYSLLNQFYVPAEAAYLPSTVSKSTLPQANSVFFMTVQAALILGFGFAGIVQRMIGFQGALYLSGAFLFIAFLSTTFLKELKPDKAIPGKFEKAVRTFFESLLEGYRFIKSNKSVLYPLLLLLGIQSGLAIIVVSLPALAVQILSLPVSLAGVWVAVPAGFGAILGTIFIPRLMNRGVRKIQIIKNSLLGVSIILLSLALLVPALPGVYRLLLATLLISVAGFSFVGSYLPTLTFLQSTTPLWLRGRVFGNLYFLITLVTIFPVLFSGAITEIFGIRTLVSLLAIFTLSVFVFSVKKGETLIKEEFYLKEINQNEQK